MIRIKIEDLPKDQKVSIEELRKILGGFNPQPEPPRVYFNPYPIPRWWESSKTSFYK